MKQGDISVKKIVELRAKKYSYLKDNNDKDNKAKGTKNPANIRLDEDVLKTS